MIIIHAFVAPISIKCQKKIKHYILNLRCKEIRKDYYDLLGI